MNVIDANDFEPWPRILELGRGELRLYLSHLTPLTPKATMVRRRAHCPDIRYSSTNSHSSLLSVRQLRTRKTGEDF